MAKTILLPLLADGEFHSGQDLANALGVSRTAVWKQLQRLSDMGLELESVKGLGYRIPQGLQLLDKAQIEQNLTAVEASQLDLQIFDTIDSTNTEALRRIEQGARSGLVCTAEQQTAGRGRRGRQWVSPYARNIYLSLVWEFTQGASALEGLSLAVGVAVARALESQGFAGVGLKWPNDLLVGKAKLGGVLLEMAGDAAGVCQVVIGVGLNVAMPDNTAADIDQSWTDLTRVSKDTSAAGLTVGQAPQRNALLAALLNELIPMVAGFENEGFTAWRDQWLALDAFAGAPVTLHSGENIVAGTARGVDKRGALQLETATGLQSIYGGEISMRAAS